MSETFIFYFGFFVTALFVYGVALSVVEFNEIGRKPEEPLEVPEPKRPHHGRE